MFVVAVMLCVLYSCFVAFSTLFAIFVNLLVMYFCNFYHLIRTKLEPVAVQSSAAALKVKCNYTRLTVSVDESAASSWNLGSPIRTVKHETPDLHSDNAVLISPLLLLCRLDAVVVTDLL